MLPRCRRGTGDEEKSEARCQAGGGMKVFAPGTTKESGAFRVG